MPMWDLVSCASQKWPMRFLCSHRNSWIPLGHGASQVALVVENLPANAGDIRDGGTIPGSGRSPGGGYGNPLQYSCLENPMDRGAWRAIVHSVAKSWRRLKWLGMHTRLGHGHYSPWQRGPQAPGWGSSPCQQFAQVTLCSRTGSSFGGGACLPACLLCPVWLCVTSWTVASQGYRIHGILQVRVLEWVAISSSRGSSPPRDWTGIPCVSCIAGRFFTTEPSWKPLEVRTQPQTGPGFS